MKRRTLLRGLAATGTLSLTAGCLAESPGDQPTDTDDSTDDETPTDTSTPTDTGDHVDTVSGTDRDPEPSDTPGMTDSSFSVTGSGCGAETDDASVSFDDGDGTVTVSGTTWGNDACYTAALAETNHESDALTVVVASESDAGTDTACAQCITEIDYEATVTFDGSLPSRVEVKHRHGDDTSTVTTTDN